MASWGKAHCLAFDKSEAGLGVGGVCGGNGGVEGRQGTQGGREIKMSSEDEDGEDEDGVDVPVRPLSGFHRCLLVRLRFS